MAFTKIYENLLPQIYKNIPAIKRLDISTVIAKYGKATILKYINNKLDFQPNSYVLDDPDERNIMKEILIEMEKLLFSDSKVKIFALNASRDLAGDKAKLEGMNMILRKNIEELLLHFNLPFAQEGTEPTIEELVLTAAEKFEEITGKPVAELGISSFTDAYSYGVAKYALPTMEGKAEGYIGETIRGFALKQGLSIMEKLLRLYLLGRNDSFKMKVKAKIEQLAAQAAKNEDDEARLFNEEFIFGILKDELKEITGYIFKAKDKKITPEFLHDEVRAVALFLIGLMNRTKSTEYYNRYNYTLIKFIETVFSRQNSSFNEMIQHGITLHKNVRMETAESGVPAWINDLITKCGVIGLEQPVQAHTRIATDAKKRIYPFHKADRSEEVNDLRDYSEPHEYIKSMKEIQPYVEKVKLAYEDILPLSHGRSIPYIAVVSCRKSSACNSCDLPAERIINFQSYIPCFRQSKFNSRGWIERIRIILFKRPIRRHAAL